MFQKIRSTYYIQEAQEIQRLEIVKLPSYKITNELDKWILAEVNTLGLELEVQMNKYVLDNGAKLVL